MHYYCEFELVDDNAEAPTVHKVFKEIDRNGPK